MDYSPFSPPAVKSLLQSEGLWLSKKRGQNYLIDRNIAEKIVAAIPSVGYPVLEVGAGLGALTVLACEQHQVYALEIDRGIVNLLQRLFTHPQLTLLHADFLKFDPQSIGAEHLFFLSNLPYSITGEAVKRFIDAPQFSHGVVMVQKEFSQRASAPAGSPHYGVLSVLCQTYLNIEELFPVSRQCFFPVPEVDSTVLSISKIPASLPQEDFRRFLVSAFQSRRKTLRNNLKSYDLPSSLPVSLDLRPEEVSPPQWAELFRLLFSRL